MGTSASSKGPHGGVSFDPPWLTVAETSIGVSPAEATVASPIVSPAIAPASRFTAARREFRDYASGRGGRSALRKAMREYVRHGLGGAARATKRIRFTTAVGARTFSLLRGLDAVDEVEFRKILQEVLASSDHTTGDVVSAIVEFVVRDKGGADEESARMAMAEALSDLFAEKPEIDVLAMTEDDTWLLMEMYLEKEIVRRINFDIGQSIESDAYDAEKKIERLEELESFVRSEVAIRLQQARAGKLVLSQRNVYSIIVDATFMTLKFFGGEV